MRMKSCLRYGAWPVGLWLLLGFLAGCSNSLEQDVKEEFKEPFQLDKVTVEQRNEWFDAANQTEPSPLKRSASDDVDKPKAPRAAETLDIHQKPTAPSHEAAAAAAETLKLTQPAFADATEVNADFNFKAAAMADVIPVFSSLLNFNYAIEGALPGTVTMSMHEKVSKEKLWEVFQQLLRLSGVVGNFDGKIFHLRAATAVPQELTLDSAGKNLEMGVFRLKYAAPAEIAGQVRKFLTRDVRAIELPKVSTLLVLDTPEAVAKLSALIEELDRPGSVNLHRAVFPCTYITEEQISKELRELLPLLGFPVAASPDKRNPGEVAILALPRLHAVAVSAAGPEVMGEVEHWMQILDQEDSNQEQLFIYEVEHARAEVLAKALATMYTVTGTGVTPNGQTISENANMNSASGLGGNDTAVPGSIFTEPVRIWCDSLNQRLSIRTTPRVYASIKAFLARLDTIPPQVLLQVLVVEIALSDTVKFGVEFMQQLNVGDWEGEAGTDYKTLVPGDTKSNYGTKVWVYDPENPTEKYGYLNALAGQSNVRLISSPQLLIVSDNEAMINVGDQVPIITSEITNSSSASASGTSLVRNVTYKNTGIQLTVKPRITRGGRIDMVLKQEVSEAQTNTTSNIDSPQVMTRKVETVMSLKNGQLLVCGGLIREKVTDNLDSLPVISNIPFLRRLLGDTNLSTARTEMLVLITGTIITEDTDLQKMVKGYRHSVDSLVEFTSPNSESNTRQNRFKHSGDLDKWFLE